MGTFTSHSPVETESLGEQWGRDALPGLVIGLSGDLGAGKTQLVKGLARGLGIAARIHSPTFALINIYEGGRLSLFHLDLYRLDAREQMIAAGLEEYLSPGKQPQGVTVVEWAEKWFTISSASPPPALHAPRSTLHAPLSAPSLVFAASALKWVRIETLNDTDRLISYEDIGA